MSLDSIQTHQIQRPINLGLNLNPIHMSKYHHGIVGCGAHAMLALVLNYLIVLQYASYLPSSLPEKIALLSYYCCSIRKFYSKLTRHQLSQM